MAIRAIPTTYRDIEFRSRLEARWAIFFDSLGVPWRYEPEGYQLQGVRYVPDFWLPGCESWVEVKPAAPDELESKKAKELSEATGKRVIVAFPEVGYWLNEDWKYDGAYLYECGGGWDCTYTPCICPVCGKFGFEYEGRGSRICAHEETRNNDRVCTGDCRQIVEAVHLARTRRFWNPREALH